MDNPNVFNSEHYLKEIRPFIKPADFLAWDSESPLGDSIQLFTGSDDNHGCLADRLTGVAGDRLFTLEALGGPFRPYYLSLRLQEHRGHVWWYPLCDSWDNDAKRREIMLKAYNQIGIGYDYASLLENAIHPVDADPTKLFCYEACFLAYGFEGKVPVSRKEFENLGIFKEGVLIK